MHDIHTHLYWKSYDADRDAVVARAREAGVKEMLVIGCTVEESRQSIELAEKYEDMYAAVGIHPHFFNELAAGEDIEEITEELRELAKHEKVVAIGECGLDYYSHEIGKTITDEQKKVQKIGFLAQIDLAEELGLPLILHCRTEQGKADAYEDMFEILSNLTPKASTLNAVLHCYMGDIEVTRKFLTLPNVYFSFTGNITYPVKKAIVGTKDDLSETVKMIPLPRIFAETDCPFLSPQSHRGERNEPAFVNETIRKIAEIHGIPGEEVAKMLDVSYKKIFKE